VTGDGAPAPVTSPCTRVCRIDGSSGLCAGCARTLDEIARWSAMSEAERLQVCAQLPGRMADAASRAAPQQASDPSVSPLPGRSAPLPRR
jgi:predicted Fe-S protein YdhL (DUF1289 family)